MEIIHKTKQFAAKFVIAIPALLACCLFTQCDSSTEEETVNPAPTIKDTLSIPPQNRSQPTNIEELHILAIGNSYTDDATRYVKEILKSTPEIKNKVHLYVASLPAYSLQQWCEMYERNDTIGLRHEEKDFNDEFPTTLKETFSKHWDIIVLQQYSRLSADYSSFNPYLAKLANYAIQDGTNPQVCIAWHMTWTYWDGYTGFPASRLPYSGITSATQEMMRTNKIEVVIPSGTAIENARHSPVNMPYSLTRDGVHLSYGTGCYVAACVWFQKLIKPVFNVDVSETDFHWDIRSWEYADTKYDAADVTDENYRLCQQCAIAAVESPFSVTLISE